MLTSKTCSQNQKAKSSLQTDKDKENRGFTLTAQKGSSAMIISISSSGEIMVQDYSHRDARHKLVEYLQGMGIETETIFDSPCG